MIHNTSARKRFAYARLSSDDADKLSDHSHSPLFFGLQHYGLVFRIQWFQGDALMPPLAIITHHFLTAINLQRVFATTIVIGDSFMPHQQLAALATTRRYRPERRVGKECRSRR